MSEIGPYKSNRDEFNSINMADQWHRLKRLDNYSNMKMIHS